MNKSDVKRLGQLRRSVKEMYDRDLICGINNSHVHLEVDAMIWLVCQEKEHVDIKFHGAGTIYPVEIALTVDGTRFMSIFTWQEIEDNRQILLPLLPLDLCVAYRLWSTTQHQLVKEGVWTSIVVQ